MLSTSPTLSDIWTACLLAYRCQFQFAQLRLNFVEIGADRDLLFQPGWQSQSFLLALFTFQFALILRPFVLRFIGILNKVLETRAGRQALTNRLDGLRARVLTLTLFDAKINDEIIYITESQKLFEGNPIGTTRYVCVCVCLL